MRRFWDTNDNLWSIASEKPSSTFMTGADYANRYTWLIVGTCIAYFPVIWLLQWIMKSRPPMKLKWTSFTWNMILSVLSGIGASIFLIYDPKCLIKLEVLENELNKKIYYVIVIFCLTKWIEFGDTILLILKKKPLLFLHVYHHFTVALYGWHSQTISIHFRHHLTFINLSIHFVMYFYYALVSVVPRNPVLRYSRSYITMIQTIQMFVGIWVSWVSIQNEQLKDQAKLNVLYALLMYISYAYLFVMFYLQNYVASVHSTMTIVIGTIHAGALIGAAKLWYHQQWNWLMLELLIGYTFTVIVLKNFGLPFGTLLLKTSSRKNSKCVLSSTSATLPPVESSAAKFSHTVGVVESLGGEETVFDSTTFHQNRTKTLQERRCAGKGLNLNTVSQTKINNDTSLSTTQTLTTETTTTTGGTTTSSSFYNECISNENVSKTDCSVAEAKGVKQRKQQVFSNVNITDQTPTKTTPALAQLQRKFQVTRTLLMLQNTWITWALEHRFLQKIMSLQRQESSKKLYPTSAPSSNLLAKNLIFKSDIPVGLQGTLALIEEHMGGVCFSFKIHDWFLLLISFGLSAFIGYLLHNDWILGCLVHGCLRWIIELHTTGTLLAREMIIQNFSVAP